MSAGTYNILAEQGATFIRTVLYTDSAGDPIDLTGFTAAMQIRSTASSGTVILELTTENTRITLGDAAGTVILSINASTMISFTPGKFVYDLELYNGAEVTRLIEGSFTVKAEVTRA